MNTLLLIVTTISTVTSCIVSCVHAWIAFKKSKEPPKDETWETATQLMCAGKDEMDATEFAKLYTELKLLKDNPKIMVGKEPMFTLSQAVEEQLK